MSDDVQVKFGANIGEATAGIEQVGEKLKDLNPEVRELVEAFGGLRRTFIEAFAVDEIAEFVSHIAELGENAIRSSEMLGIGVEKVQELGFAARMVGGSSEGMNTALERLEKNMANIGDSSSMAARAFAALGISAEEIKNKSPDQVLGLIAEKFAGAQDGAAKTAIAMDLMGRSGAQMIPLLNQGSEGLRQMGALAEETGSSLTTLEAEGLEKTAQGITTLKASVEGAGISLLEVFKPAIDAVISGLTSLVQTFRAAIEMIRVLVDLMEGGLAIAVAALIEQFAELEVKVVRVFDNIKLKTQEVMAVLSALAHGSLQEAVNAQNEGEQKIAQSNAAAQQKVADLGRQYDALKEKIENATQAALTFGTSEASESKKQLTAPSSGAAAGPDNSLALDDIKTEEELAKLKLQLQKNTLDQQVALGQISKAQELAALQELLGKEYDAELAALEQKKSLYAQGTTEFQEALNQEDILLQKYLVDYQKINDQIAQANAAQIKKTQAEYKSFFDTIDKDLDAMLQGVLQGTQTWQQAMAKVFDNLALSFIEDVTKMLVKAAALKAVNFFGGAGGNLSGAIGGEVPQALGGTQSNASNPLTAAVTALTTALGLSTTTQATSTAIAQTSATVVDGLSTVTGANTTATLANTLAEQAAAASSGGGGILGGILGSGGSSALESVGETAAIASLDVGAWSIPQNGLAFLHAGEMVIPQNAAQTFRAGSSNFGPATESGPAGNFTINVNAIDTQTGASFLKQNAGVIAQTLATQIRNGNSSLMSATRT